MDTAITVNSIVSILATVAALVAGFAAIKKIIDVINEQHDKMQKYDSYQEQINTLNASLTDIKTEMTDKIEATHNDTEAKIQLLMNEQYIMTESMLAVLEGLKQLNCNGPVTEARNKLEEHLNKQAHERT